MKMADKSMQAASPHHQNRRGRMSEFTFKILEGSFSIHRFEPSTKVPKEVFKSGFFAVCRTDEELSVVCPASLTFAGSKCNTGWAGMKIVGPLDLNEVGVMAGVLRILSVYGISIFAVSTYDTDYIFVKAPNLKRAVSALKNAGYKFM